MTRVVGPKGSPRRRWLLLWCLVAAVGTSVFVLAGAQAAGPGGTTFELDASLDLSNGSAPKAAVTDHSGTGLPDDWDRVAADKGLATNGATTSNATASTFDAETTASGSANNATIFTGGGSKDQAAVGDWKWKDASGGLPDKDNLLHAMSARYTTGSGPHIYFAADRFDNSGDSQIGFWFFKNSVSTKDDGTFSGVHAAGSVPHDPDNPGDVLILSDFTNGGAQPTVRVFEFVGSGGSDGSLNLLGGTADDIRDCGVVGTDDFCGSVNNLDGAVAPWLLLNKSGQSTFGHGELYEGGLNLTALGLQNECFSSFLAETRSSQSVTATLKDFVLGPFQQCTASAVTTPSVSAPVAPGTAVYDTDVITGTGVQNPPNPSSPPNVTFSICGPMTVATSCDGSDSAHTAAAFGATKPLVHCTGAGTPSAICTAADAQGVSRARSDTVGKTATGFYCFKAEWDGDANYPAGADDAGSSGSECFRVRDTSTTTTAQRWLPNDTATVTTGSGATAAGSVTFTLYDSADCTGTVLGTWTDTSAPYESSNTTVQTTSKSVSWRAVFTSTDSNVNGSTSRCETTTVTVDNDSGP